MGEGSELLVTTYELRGTLITIFFKNGHPDSSIVMRTAKRDLKSLKSYQLLRGKTGLEQQHPLVPVRKRSTVLIHNDLIQESQQDCNQDSKGTVAGKRSLHECFLFRPVLSGPTKLIKMTLNGNDRL